MATDQIMVNRAPVLTLWGAVVAARLGYDWEEALSLGQAMAGLNAQSKGRALGIYGPPKGREGDTPKKVGLGEEFWVALLGRHIPAKQTEQGVRAVTGDKPVDADRVARYLEAKFGEALPAVREALEQLAAALDPAALEEEAFPLYERFRPAIEPGTRGWGQKGVLDLAKIREMAQGKTS
jgi:hypothetical protein